MVFRPPTFVWEMNPETCTSWVLYQYRDGPRLGVMYNVSKGYRVSYAIPLIGNGDWNYPASETSSDAADPESVQEEFIKFVKDRLQNIEMDLSQLREIFLDH